MFSPFINLLKHNHLTIAAVRDVMPRSLLRSLEGFTKAQMCRHIQDDTVLFFHAVR